MSKKEDAFLDTISRATAKDHVVFCCQKFRVVTIKFVRERVTTTAQQDIKTF